MSWTPWVGRSLSPHHRDKELVAGSFDPLYPWAGPNAPPNEAMNSIKAYRTTVPMTYNGQGFLVKIQATFMAIDQSTSLPPANVLTGFLPPEDGTGRGSGYLSYTVVPKLNLPT